MRVAPTVQANSVAKVLEHAKKSGLAVDPLLAAVGWTRADLAKPDARVSFRKLVALYEEAAARLDDAAFGLRVGASSHPRMFDVLGYAALSRSTLGAAFDLVERYLRVLQEGARVELRRRGASAAALYAIDDPHVGPCRHEVEATIGIIWRFLCAATGREIQLERVRLAHPAPADTREHRRILRAPVEFASRENAVVFQAKLLDEPLTSADPVLAAVLERNLDEVLARLPGDDLLERVRRDVATSLQDDAATLPRAARRLGTSARTLQRWLRARDATYESIVDEVRHGLALRYLGNDMSIADVAFLLGYAEVGAFHRAFKRWTGSTPRGVIRASRSPRTTSR